MNIIRKTTHLSNILQTVILFGFALYFVVVILSGSVYRYVHERQVPMLWFSAAVFLLLGILKLRQGKGISVPLAVFRGNSGYSEVFSFVIFAVALVGMSAASGAEIRFSQFAYTGSIGEQSAYSSAAASHSGNTQAVSSSDAAMPSAAVSTTGAASAAIVEPKMRSSDGSIVMDSDTFAPWLTELYTNPDAWVGKKITAIGSVWKDGELFEEDEFALARMMMTCCAADMQPVGLLAQWNNVQALTDGAWIEVTGTLSKKPYKDGFDPLIIVEMIKRIDLPQRAYIYP